MLVTENSAEKAVGKPRYSLNQLYFYLTEGCNLCCRHCWINPKFQGGEREYPSLDFKLFCSILEEAKPLGLTGVKLTGGEPFLHPQVMDIIRHVKKQELGLTVETNGVLCTPELAKEISEAKRYFVSVSLDGACAETYEWVRGVEGSFERALQGIRNLVAVGIRPQIILSVMRRNKDEMEPIVRLAESLGAGSVKYNLVQPTERGEQMRDAGETLSIEELYELGQWVENTLSKQTKLRLIYHHPVAFKPLGEMFGGNGCGTCSIKTILGVLSDGSYALCGIGTSVPELVFGKAGEDRLEDVWNNTPVLNEIREGMPEKLEGVCADCIMKNRCLGSCVAQNYYTHKNVWAGFWFCEEAKAAGLFPETRLKGNLKAAA